MFVNPFKSKRFLTMLVDVLGSTALFFIGKYGTPSLLEDIKFLIVSLQPVFIVLIGMYGVEDLKLADKDRAVMELMQKFDPRQFAILFKEVMEKQEDQAE